MGLCSKAKGVLNSDILGYAKQFAPGGKVVGDDYVALNPCRSDNRLGSFKISLRTGRFCDFASGDSGDLLDLLASINGITAYEAAKTITGDNYMTTTEHKTTQQEKIEPITPISTDGTIVSAMHGEEIGVWNKDNHHKTYRPDSCYIYRNKKNEVVGMVMRINSYGGNKKLIIPITPRNGRWITKGFDRPYPIYGADLLASQPDDTVVITEGEKCADITNLALRIAGVPNTIAISWPNGCGSVDKPNWGELAGRTVILNPDNDEHGFEAMRYIESQLLPLCRQVLWVKYPSFSEPGYDSADFVRDFGWHSLVKYIETEVGSDVL